MDRAIEIIRGLERFIGFVIKRSLALRLSYWNNNLDMTDYRFIYKYHKQ